MTRARGGLDTRGSGVDVRTDDGDPARPDPRDFTTAADWAQGLRRLRERSGLSVRDLARAARASSSTVGGYVSGRHLPTIGATGLVERVLLACGVDDDAERAAWVDALNRVRRTPGPRPVDGPAPYKGLAGYDVADAPWFRGRESLTERLVAEAESGPGSLLLLVGASGSGKSSILRAGLAATLAGRGWDVHVCTPGAEPEAAVIAVTSDVARGAAAGRRALVVVDQLEELWTAGGSPDHRRAAVRRLVELAAAPAVVVAALRADFYAHALDSPALAAALQHHQVVVGPMTRDALVRAITEPAAKADVELEGGLVEVLLRDLAPPGQRADGEAHDPGALPLLSFALLQTWQQRRDRLTVAGYLRSGGIEGAVAAAAERVYSDLGAHERALARRLFTRLVAVAEETADTRRRVSRAELDGLDAPHPAGGAGDPARGAGVADVVEQFVAARLLTAGESSVEITHEALLRAWPRLRQWLDDDRAGLVLQRALADGAAAWEAAGHEPDSLLRGGRLEATLEWASTSADAAALTSLERVFLDASATAAAAERLTARRRTRRLQALSAGLVAGLVAVAVLAVYAQNVRAGAERARDLALSRQLAEAANRLRTVDPVVAAQFALLGYRTAPTVESRSALLDTSALPLARRLDGPGGISYVAVSADGTLVAAVGAQGGLRLWQSAADADVATGRPVRTATVPDAYVDPADRDLYAVAVDPTGDRVATGGRGGAVRLWDTSDPARPTQLGRLDTGGLTVLGLAVSRTGVLAAALTGPGPDRPDVDIGRVALWRLDAAGATPLGAPVDLGQTVHAVGFSPDGAVLAVGTGDGAVHRLTVGAGAPRPTGQVLRGPTEPVTSVAFAPDGLTVAAGAKDLQAHVWRLMGPTGAAVPPDPAQPTRTALALAGAQSWVNAVAFSPDGHELVAGSSDSRLRVYDTATYGLVTEVGNPGPVTTTVYRSDGAGLLSAGADGAVRIWPHPLPLAGIAGGRTFGLAYLDDTTVVGLTSAAARLFDVGTPFAAAATSDNMSAPQNAAAERFAGTLAVSPDGTLMASGGRAGSIWLYRFRDGRIGPAPVGSLVARQSKLLESAAFTADGRTLVTGSDDATLAFTDVSDPAAPRPLGGLADPGGIVYALAASPTGRLVAAGTGAGGDVQLWDVSDPDAPRRLGRAPDAGKPSLQVYGLSFTRDGRTLAVGSADRTVRFLDVSRPDAPAWTGSTIDGPGDYVYSVQFSRDGTRLATASGDGVVRLYDVTDVTVPRPLAALSAAGRVALYSVALSPGGRRVSAGGAPEAVYTWMLDPSAAVRRICDLAGDPVTEQEWRQYLPSVSYADPCS
jgi:WD40 repeat protein/transcriptional regulator with XRE-family HTH domain